MCGCFHPEAAAEAELLLADMHWYEGSRALAAEDMQRAAELVGETSAAANVFEHAARFAMLAGENDEAIRLTRARAQETRRLGGLAGAGESLRLPPLARRSR